MAKEAYYFSHDSNARHDPKITAMRGVYGSVGYAWFFMFIEMMRETDGYRLDIKSKYAFNAYAMQMQCEPDAIASFVHDCVNEFDLFLSDGDTFWSESLIRRMDKAHERSKKAADSANARWSKRPKNANASKSNANASKMDAIKESKESKESKDINPCVECDEEFENWYSIYPKEGSVRKKAYDSWKILWRDKKIDIDKLISGTHAYINYQNHNEYKICGAQVFLNQQRWNDEWKVPLRAVPKPSSYEDHIMKLNREKANQNEYTSNF